MFPRSLVVFALVAWSASARAQTASAPEPLTLDALTPEPLTLEVALEQAFQNHGDIGAARASLQAARERITVAKSNRAPQLSATLGSNYQNGRVVSGPISPVGTISNFSTSTGVALSQNVFDSGRTKFQIRGARAGAAFGRGNLALTRGELAFEVTSRFYDQGRAARLVTQRIAQIQVAQQQLDQIQAQIEAGTSPRSDLDGARVSLSQARLDLTIARSNLNSAAARFRNALGLERGPRLELIYDSSTNAREIPSIEAAFQTARARRPELWTARAEIAQNAASLQSARIEARPNVSVSTNLNLDPRDLPNRLFGLGATLSIPIFDAGGRRANARAAQQELSGAGLRLIQRERDALADVEVALFDLEGQAERLSQARDLVRAAQTNLASARGRYGAGVGIALDVTTAQTRLFEAQTSLIGAEFDEKIAFAALERATGGQAWEGGIVPREVVDVASVK